jgi:hypothetical protein
MTNNYMAPEVLEIGAAEEVILGEKLMFDLDYDGQTVMPDSSLDD